jgi:hypothetical protein
MFFVACPLWRLRAVRVSVCCRVDRLACRCADSSCLSYIESQSLVCQSFGPQLLASLGWVYTSRARKFLSGQGLSFSDGGGCQELRAAFVLIRLIAGGLEVMASLKKSRRGAAQKLAIGANIFKSVRAVQGIAEAGQGKGDSADTTITTGCYVKINGLKNRPELNDVVGVVLQVEGESVVVATQVMARCCMLPVTR